MNERIWELAEQAYEFAHHEYPKKETEYGWEDFFKKTFAELIVRDCLSIADRKGAYEVMDDIINHFGVEA